jgi:hypothetical protein
MSVHASVQAAHDALLALPEARGVGHSCPLCTAGTDSAKEGASVSETAANANVYTEAQNFALLTSAVERETASLTGEKKTLEAQVGTLESEKATLADELAGLKNRLDVLEAEKAAAEARADAAAQEFADYKAEQALQAQIAELKTSRVEQVKAANATLGADFFSEERAARWAAMSEEAFAALLADITEVAAAGKSEGGGDGGEKKKDVEMARETAAFTGGRTATSTEGDTTTLSRVLAYRRGAVA